MNVGASVRAKRAGWLGASALALAVLAGAGVFLPRGAARSPPGSTPAGGEDWVGRVAPDFELSALDGRRLRLSDFRGRVVLVNFWATWCEPCRVETPWLVDLDGRYRTRGLTILGVSLDDGDRDQVAGFVRARHVGYPILLKDQQIERRYGGVRYLPQTFFIGRDGRILARVYGIRTRSDFEAAVRRALCLPPPLA